MSTDVDPGEPRIRAQVHSGQGVQAQRVTACEGWHLG